MKDIKDCIAIEGEELRVYDMAEYTDNEIKSMLEHWAANFEIPVTWTDEDNIFNIIDKHFMIELMQWRRTFLRKASNQQP